jgi:cytochrome c oxidase accessory protein FixG
MYFSDAPTLTVDFWSGHAAPVAYATVAVLTGITFWFGGFMREQVCIYMCPWPRIQTAMLDEKSLLVTYKDWRGEPRASVKATKADPDGKFGDCIDCNQCVAVCPTGIDIRQGPQIGCITCALCIDACDRVMQQVGRPRGLIDYATLEDAAREQAGNPPTPHRKLIWHPRTLVYLGIWSAIGLALLFALGTRRHLDLAVQKDRNPPYMLLSDGSVRNAWTLKLKNMEGRPRNMEVALEGLPGAVMWTDTMGRDQGARRLVEQVPADTTEPVRVYVAAPAGTGARTGGGELAFVMTALDKEGGRDRVETRFDAPDEEEHHDDR